MAIVQYFATAADHVDFLNLIRSHFVHIYPAELHSRRSVEDFECYPGHVWCISNVPLDEIIEHPAAPGFPDACNPIVRWAPATVKDRHLVAGSISWIEFSKNICQQTGADHRKVVEIGAVFRKLNAWMKKNWINLDGDNFWFGPGAAHLKECLGYIASSSFNEDTVIEQILLDDVGGDSEIRRLGDISEFEDR